MRLLTIYIPIFINKLYRLFKKKRTHLTLEVPLELDDIQSYDMIVAQTIKLMEHNIKIKNK
jgi:hypothetical protein